MTEPVKITHRKSYRELQAAMYFARLEQQGPYKPKPQPQSWWKRLLRWRPWR